MNLPFLLNDYLKGRGIAVELAVSAEELDFGDVWVDSVKSVSLSVENKGNVGSGDVVLSWQTGDAFAVDPSSLSLGAGETKSIRVTFEPRSMGTYADVLRLRIGGEVKDSVEVSGSLKDVVKRVGFSYIHYIGC